MADAALSAFLQVLFQGIADFVKNELQLERGLDNDCERLILNVEVLQNFLGEAEKRQLSNSVQLLFGKLKDVGYDAMEVLDEASYESQRHQVIHLASLRNLIRSPVIFRHAMRKKINAISQKIEDIRSNATFLKEFRTHKESTPQQTCLRPTVVYGRKNDQEKIVSMLLQSDLKPDIAVLPIVGEPYIGKTIVTKEVFSNEQISRYFELRLWVHVSHDFNIEKITASIIESIEVIPFHCSNLNTLQLCLEKQLRGRRYLLVLDDYWREKWYDWDKLRLPLLTGAAGSKIIVTTRSMVVAEVLGTIGPYKLPRLPEEDCWLLFRRCALRTDTEEYNSGDSLNNRTVEGGSSKECRGVPFIAASLGHKVRQERDRNKWATIVQNESWKDSDFDRALRLHYAQLESHLKPCFAYTSVIPPKVPFNEEWLIRHWMAQGFIQPNPDKETIEEIGRSYFRYLVERSFFQRAGVDPSGEQHGYILPQMMHDLAFHVSGEDCKCYIMGMRVAFNQQKVQHLTIDLNKLTDQNMFDVISEGKCLRTLIVVGGSENFVLRIPDDIEKRFPRLQTLDLSNSGVTELPESIGQLKHLRLTCMPKHIGLLTDLQTLSRFVISKESTLSIHTHKGGIRELANLNDLHGELLISGLEHINDVEEAAHAHLDSKEFLQKIGLSWSGSNKHDEQIMERLKPPTTIEDLTISGYAGMACPRWLSSPDYEKLITLHLYDFKSCTVVPCVGQLPLLEKLSIKGWDGLVSMNCSKFCGRNTACFRSLKKLHLERLDRLYRWDGDDACKLPVLVELVIKNCCKLEQVTHKFPSLVKITVEKSPNFFGLRNFPSLTHVDVTASGEWIWGSWSTLSSPISITLSKLPTVWLPLGTRWFHSSLQRLDISHCDHLECMPEDWPPCNLSHFSVRHCPQLRKLPNGIRHLRSLEDLEIIGCGQLTYLPDMVGLTSLLRMEISGCGSIQSLPCLPSSMQFLSINKCPQLRMNEGGLDQANIKRIFSVWIDGREVFSSANEPRFDIPSKLQKAKFYTRCQYSKIQSSLVPVEIQDSYFPSMACRMWRLIESWAGIYFQLPGELEFELGDWWLLTQCRFQTSYRKAFDTIFHVGLLASVEGTKHEGIQWKFLHFGTSVWRYRGNVDMEGNSHFQF
uniref:NB-ARC domain-containing protein n=1 Tax=Leersia perrieri TaxID=77586 RepID=A0A0D9XLB2_9ORYZ